jgi:HD superfamily phosphodiesterase
MNLTASIESAELRFKQILEDFFISVYDEKNLPSHGIDHHRRVWGYAKELLSRFCCRNNSHSTCDPSKLIIASYIHDIGMSVEPGPRHGKISRDFCIQFFDRYNLDKDEYTDVLETIENHDKKDYSADTGTGSLLTILSVADDLDAFGFIGIYRYSEIYIKRGIDPHNLGYLIRENASKRFQNFATIFSLWNEYVQSHRKRYNILDEFFVHYNIKAASCDFNSYDPEGYCGIIQLFTTMSMKKLSLQDLFFEAGKYRNDIIIASYVNGLNSELHSRL